MTLNLLTILSGKQTPQRLAFSGSSTQYLDGNGSFTTPAGAGVSSGTSNPGSPSTGDLFFRTDLGLLIYYDGTRWLTVHLYHMSIGRNFTDMSATSVGNFGASVGGAYDLWIEDILFSSRVQTTNDATHRWTLEVYRSNVTGADTSIASRSTSADGTAKKNAVVAVDALAGTDLVWLYTFGTKTNSPGVLQVAATVTYRLVVT